MPWCPRCDETFPEGPACPRCSARLIERERNAMHEELEAVPDLASLKVSRRDRRALERLSGPRTPSPRALIAAIAALVFAVGFLLGRLASIEPDQPSVRALPAAAPLTSDQIEGSAAYLLWTEEPLATIAIHDLPSGEVVPLARFTPPFDPRGGGRTQVVALGGSVALVVNNGKKSFVAFTTPGEPPHGWVPGVEAAWATTARLLVRQADGAVVEWSVAAEGFRPRTWGRATRIFQSASGAVVQRSAHLASVGRGAPQRELALSGEDRVLATDGRHALLAGDRLLLVDDESTTRVRLHDIKVLGASFEPAGERVAIVLRQGDELGVAVVDSRGNAALKPLGTKAGDCRPAVSWDAGANWIYVAPGDGVLYAVEAAGGRVEHVRTRSVGCGVAWLDLAS